MTLRKMTLRAATAALLVAGLVHAAPALAQTANADLTLTVDDPGSIGFPTVYSMIVTNNGPDAAATVTVSATLPAGAEVTAVKNCTPAVAATATTPATWFPCKVTDSLAATKDSLPVDITVKYTVPTECPATDLFYGAVTFTAASAATDATPADNTQTLQPPIVLPLVDIAVTIAGPASIPHGGGTFVYSYTVKNNGPCAAPDVFLAVDDSVATGFEWVSATGVAGELEAMSGETINGDFTLVDDVAVDYQYATVSTLASGASVSGNKTYKLKALADDLISSNQGTGLQVIFYDPNTGDDLVLTDSNAKNDTASKTYVVTKSAGCSTTGSGNGLFLAGLGLAALLLKRRRSA